MALGGLLGILQHDPDEWLSFGLSDVPEEDIRRIETLIAERTEAKTAKNFARADEIRDELTAMGIQIKDTREGVVWEKSG